MYLVIMKCLTKLYSIYLPLGLGDLNRISALCLTKLYSIYLPLGLGELNRISALYKEKYLYVSLERCVSPFGLDYGFNPARH
ncbi:hypothetical protein L249_1980 [Ophiocordyceps polyrhachis-furcata BCC 54312]|uniref:Uncharacterized protein n=1 Tax=Ophiocordyceps polyrhachis-furcata BCC 54312 TaxID=1330021 RepID=A0A367LPS2_9HYPO|nr:hypothetical protein L249_1980 [Ophiocordyceps polyrhachis-furcata BCC 54312]